jgi:putative thiamine transport system permease protein
MQAGLQPWKKSGYDDTTISYGDKVINSNKTRLLSLFPLITFTCFMSAILVGLVSTWMQSFGYLPSIGFHHFSLDYWQQLFSYPGFENSLTATLISGFGATFLSLFITFLLFAVSYQSRFWKVLDRALAPLLSIPHAAFAIGFLFLVTPSGWLLRLFSPGLTGFEIPPDWMIMKDANGFSLMLGLVLKEVPFLVLMSLGALSRLDTHQSLAVGRSLGYQPPQIWLKIILPQLFPKIRLAVFAVLAYSVSVVDIAQILGPTSPPTLAVQVFRWFNDPELHFRLLGSAGATLILILVAAGIGFLYLLEAAMQKTLRKWLISGKRSSLITLSKPLSNGLILAITGISILVILVLLIWSFTWRWRFPDFLPETWSLRFWIRGILRMRDPIWTTLTTGLTASVLAVFLVIGSLENEASMLKRGLKSKSGKILWLIYLPLLIPQIAFLFGVQVTLAMFRLDGFWPSLVWSHLLFVVPYVFLGLGPVYRGFDPRMNDIAVTLCSSPWRAFIKVKLPILLRPVLFSGAIGFSVSVAQYLPTLFVGAGRFETITTEAVSLASGSDRRVVAVYALSQLLTPLIIFLSAILIPKFAYRHRKGMQV